MMPKVPDEQNGVQNLLTEAMRLNQLGCWVVPCNGKRAVVKDWPQKRLSSDELRDKLSASGSNIAVALNQSNFIDVECDTAEAETNLQKLFGAKIPPTPTWKSKRGKHRLFKRSSGLPKKAKLEIDGIEFRLGNEKGALSVVPPSVHPDGPRYEWEPGLSIHEIEPAELPPDVVERLRDTASQTTAAPIKTSKGDVPEGKRNDELFKLACKLRDTGIAEPSVVKVLLAENSTRCQPPLPENEVHDVVRSAMKGGTSAKQTNAEVLLGIAANDSELWHTPDGAAYATIQVDGHREHWRIRSSTFRQWLGRRFYDQMQRVAGSQTLYDVVNTLEGKARFDGATRDLFVRVAGHDGRIYIDLGDDSWSVIEIDPEGWRIVNDPPVRFRRAKGMSSLPVPVQGGSVSELRRFVNVSDRHWPLFLGWLVASFRPTGPYPILKLLGEQGSAKTTTARVARLIIDPNTAPVRSAPRNEQDLMIAANNGWVLNFDNLSYIKPELSDALCRLATGGSWTTRTLYENDEETIFDAQRPIILNGIEDIGSRSDLLDRTLIVELPRIEPGARRTETAFLSEFEKARPRILGSLLDAVSAALRNLRTVEQSDTTWPRMADFAQWAVAAENALGLKPGEFLSAYSDNRETANMTALESSPVVTALFAMLKREPTFEGTATDLLHKLEIGTDTRVKGWPKVARVLSGILKRLAPNLRGAGIVIDEIDIGAGNAKRHGWRIESTDNTDQSRGTNRKLPQKCAPSAPSEFVKAMQAQTAARKRK